MTRQDTLIKWMDQGEAVRARVLAGGGKPGIIGPKAAGKTGLEIMHAMLAGALPS